MHELFLPPQAVYGCGMSWLSEAPKWNKYYSPCVTYVNTLGKLSRNESNDLLTSGIDLLQSGRNPTIALAWLAVAGPGELGHLQRTQTKRRRQLLLHLAKSHISRSNYPTAPLCVVVKSVLTRRVFLKGLSPSAIKFGEPESRIFANAGSIKRTKLKVCSCTAPELTVGLQIGTLLLLWGPPARSLAISLIPSQCGF